MKIGVPRERKTLEKRVAITPDGIMELVRHGHQVHVETKAGEGSHFPDEAFKAAGATIVPTLKDVWTGTDMVVKVKEPHESEYAFFRPGLTIFDYLHLASMPELTSAMVKSGVTGIAYELVQLDDRRLPLLEPMSEVAGKLSVLNGSYFLLSQNGGRGVLLGGTVGVRPGNVVIIGAGISGRAACEVALGFGATVTVLDVDYKKLERVKMEFGSRVRTVFSTMASLSWAAERADLLIGAVLIPGAAAPKLVTREIIAKMPKGSVFVDISIDQGGCGETIRTTSLADPVYEHEGVIHYGVPNMPAQTPRTSTMALTSATLPYILKLADLGVDAALKKFPELRLAVNTMGGKLTNQPVSEAVKIPYTPLEKVMSLA
jgi:alanine dehydrogenase